MLSRIFSIFGNILVLILALIWLILHICVVAYCIDFLYGPGWAKAYIIANFFFPFIIIFDMVLPIYFWYRTGNWVPFALHLLLTAIGFLVMIVMWYVIDQTRDTKRKDSDNA